MLLLDSLLPSPRMKTKTMRYLEFFSPWSSVKSHIVHEMLVVEYRNLSPSLAHSLLRSIYRIAQCNFCLEKHRRRALLDVKAESQAISSIIYMFFCSMIYALFFSYRFHLIFVYRPHDIVNSLLSFTSRFQAFVLAVQRTQNHPYHHVCAQNEIQH